MEFESKDDALQAIEGMNGQDILGQPVKVDWAFLAQAPSA